MSGYTSALQVLDRPLAGRRRTPQCTVSAFYPARTGPLNFRVAENNRPIVKTEFGSEAFERLFFFDRTDLPGG
jgi:hypothetical protein